MSEVLIPATEAKNQFGKLVQRAGAGETIIITSHDERKVVMMSVKEYDSLVGRERRVVESLRAEYDEMLRSMQTPEAKAAMRKAFSSTPEEMGKAAVEVAKRRRQE